MTSRVRLSKRNTPSHHLYQDPKVMPLWISVTIDSSNPDSDFNIILGPLTEITKLPSTVSWNSFTYLCSNLTHAYGSRWICSCCCCYTSWVRTFTSVIFVIKLSNMSVDRPKNNGVGNRFITIRMVLGHNKTYELKTAKATQWPRKRNASIYIEFLPILFFFNLGWTH